MFCCGYRQLHHQLSNQLSSLCLKMATLFSSPSLHSIRLSSPPSSTASSPSLAFCTFPFHPRSSPLKAWTVQSRRFRVAKAVEGEEVSTTESEPQQQPSTSEQQPVVVPISPSDTLTMVFQAEGILNETAVPALTKALEETDGVTNLRVHLFEGLASLELEKQTTVQATGVASSLVETIQGLGFKLQTLNLSFDDAEVAAA